MKSRILFVTFATVSIASTTFAQKPDSNSSQTYGVFQTQEEYHHFMGSAKQAAASNPEMQAMIPMLNDIALNQPIGSTNQQYGGAAGTLDLLADPEIRQDIEMVDDQYEELQTLNADIQKRMGEQLRSLDFSDSENIANKIRGIRDTAEQELNGVLLPHQVKRLQQLATQTQLRRRSFIDLLTSDPLKSRLEISDTQSEDLKKTAAEIEADLAREIARLQSDARKKLLSRLTQKQQTQVEEVFGESFEFKSKPDSTKNKPRKNGSK